MTDDQKQLRVQIAKQLLKMFPKFSQKQFANIITGDGTRVHYFSPVENIGNKIWLNKHGSRLEVMSTKSIFFSYYQKRLPV